MKKRRWCKQVFTGLLSIILILSVAASAFAQTNTPIEISAAEQEENGLPYEANDFPQEDFNPYPQDASEKISEGEAAENTEEPVDAATADDTIVKAENTKDAVAVITGVPNLGAANAAEDTQFQALAAARGVEGFVTRLYNICLKRQPDAAGLAYWVQRLKSGDCTGASAASGFVFSNEFNSQNLCNEDYIASLYQCFFDRKAEPEGARYWLNQVLAGKSRGAIFNGFVMSAEFNNICQRYGILCGTGDWSGTICIITDNCRQCGKKNNTTTQFVTRLYKEVLGREPDQGGLNYWNNELKSGKTGAEVAYGFVFGPELKKKNLCNDHFIECVYKIFLNRSSEPSGKAYWADALRKGTKGSIFTGFISSKEFALLCAQCGIRPGAQNYVSSHYTSIPDGTCASCKAGLPGHTHSWRESFDYDYVAECRVHATKGEAMFFANIPDFYLHQFADDCQSSWGWGFNYVTGRRCPNCSFYERTGHVHNFGTKEMKVYTEHVKCKCGQTFNGGDGYTALESWQTHLDIYTSYGYPYSDHNIYTYDTGWSLYYEAAHVCVCGWRPMDKHLAELRRLVEAGYVKIVDVVIDGVHGQNLQPEFC